LPPRPGGREGGKEGRKKGGALERLRALVMKGGKRKPKE